MIGGEETRWERKRSIGASKSHSGPIIRRVSHTHVATTQVGRSQRHSWATTFWRQLSPLMKNNQLPQFITLHMIPPLFFFFFFSFLFCCWWSAGVRPSFSSAHSFPFLNFHQSQSDDIVFSVFPHHFLCRCLRFFSWFLDFIDTHLF